MVIFSYTIAVKTEVFADKTEMKKSPGMAHLNIFDSICLVAYLINTCYDFNLKL